ncbi:MAG: hypothetical protein VXW65_13885 [Pseudomonadota bacterium]|nr:hypothetical protein [Pseudomonadota bacterium]
MSKRLHTVGIFCGLLASLFAQAVAESAATTPPTPIDASLLIGTWHCSFERNSDQQSIVVTSVDTYLADGTSHSESKLMLQLHPFNLDAHYDLKILATWQLQDGNVLSEAITAVPHFETSNPPLEKLISLKQELLDGKAERSTILQLDAHTAVFQSLGDDQTEQQVSCSR